MNFLQFVENKKANLQNKIMLNEAFKNSELGKARDLIVSLLRKQTKKMVVSLGDFDMEIGGNQFTSELFVCGEVKAPICFTFNWLNSGKSSEVYSISFYKDMEPFMTGKGKADLTLETMGSSIVYFIPIISHIIETQDLKLTTAEAKKYAKYIFNGSVKESSVFIGALEYNIIEGLSEETVERTFKYNLGIYESDYEDMINYKKQKAEEKKEAELHRNDSAEANNKFRDIAKEYEEIKKAIKGGATNLEELKLAVKKATTVKVNLPEGGQKIEDEIEEAKKDPDQVFKEMNKYIKMVVKGLTPAVILCGAPGVGKTYRVKQFLKANNYNEGHNLCTIKGKCSTRMLYTTLYDYSRKGDIVLIDDADGLVGPKSPEENINILKAALDSTSDDEGRLVSYGVSGKLLDDEGEPLPKKFYYNGSVIVITNYNAGQLATPLKGRGFIQDIHFSPEDILNIVKKLLPSLDPTHLSPKSKMKAYDYLVELHEKGTNMELSIRTFGICAKIFEACADDAEFTDEDAKSMIAEQMKLQAARGGRAY